MRGTELTTTEHLVCADTMLNTFSFVLYHKPARYVLLSSLKDEETEL